MPLPVSSSGRADSGQADPSIMVTAFRPETNDACNRWPRGRGYDRTADHPNDLRGEHIQKLASAGIH